MIDTFEWVGGVHDDESARRLARALVTGRPELREVTPTGSTTSPDRGPKTEARGLLERVLRLAAADSGVASLPPELLARLRADEEPGTIAEALSRDLLSLPVARALLVQSRAWRFGEPRASWRAAAVAVSLARTLVTPNYRDYQPRELVGQALSELGGALRVLSEFGSAAEALLEAEIWLEGGLADPTVWLRHWERRALVAWDVGEAKDARRLASRMARLARDVADPSETANALMLEAVFELALDHSERAVALLVEARRLAPTEGSLAFAVLHNLAVLLLDLDRVAEAAALLPRLKALSAVRPDALAEVAWLQGRLALAEGSPWAAAEYLRTAAGHLGSEAAIDQGLIRLELSLALVGCGDLRQAQPLAQEATAILAALNLHADAGAARVVAAATDSLSAAALGSAVSAILVQARALSRRRPRGSEQ